MVPEIEAIQTSLSKMIGLLESRMEICDTCMVDFITLNLFGLLPQPLQEELYTLETDSLVLLPALLHDEVSLTKFSHCPELMSTVTLLRESRMEAMDLVSESEPGGGAGLTSLTNWDKIMSAKKTHEVDQMSGYLSRLVSQHNISSLVDLGSGKAYLSQVLSSLHNIPVLAVDGRDTNTRGADLRSSNLQSKWAGLTQRASERAAGDTPSNRRTRNKVGGDRSSPGLADRSTEQARLVTITRFVERGEDISPLVQDQLGGESERIGIVGLHTCGDLASSSLVTFLHTEKAKLLCNVGCCYNHLSSQGFPLSQFLATKQFKVIILLTTLLNVDKYCVSFREMF